MEVDYYDEEEADEESENEEDDAVGDEGEGEEGEETARVEQTTTIKRARTAYQIFSMENAGMKTQN